LGQGTLDELIRLGPRPFTNGRASPTKFPPSDEGHDQLPMVLPKVIDDAVAGARGPTLIKVHAHIMYFVLPIPPEVDGLSESSLVVHRA
jgi:hypothetical protein